VNATVAIGINPIPRSTNGAVTLSWSAPTENTDGSALTNLSGYNIYYGTSAYTMTSVVSVNAADAQSYVISDLSSGLWYFEITAVNLSGVESSPSGLVSAIF
jgi:hypothetical protein